MERRVKDLMEEREKFMKERELINIEQMTL